MQLIKTPRLLVKTMSHENAGNLHHIVTDAHTMRDSATGVVANNKIAEFVHTARDSYRNTGFGYLPIYLINSQTVIGLCGFNRHIVAGETLTHINYRLAPQFLKKGYASEVVNGQINYAKKAFGLNKLSALVVPQNTPSIKVLTRCEFTFIKEIEFKERPVFVYQRDI